MLLFIMALLNVRLIFQHVSHSILLAVGWVMAVLQAALAVQYIIINGLIHLRVLPHLVS